jgi:hypothetical protein
MSSLLVADVADLPDVALIGIVEVVAELCSLRPSGRPEPTVQALASSG